MKPAVTHNLSIGATVLFAAWIVWLWVAPNEVEKIQKPVEEQKMQVVKAEPQTEAKPMPPQAFVLPAPPPPAVKSAPKPASVVKKVVKAESPKKVVKPTPKKTEKPAPKSKPVAKVKSKPAPKPKPKSVAKPAPKPKPKSVAKPAPKPTPKPAPVQEVVHEVTPTEVVGGRALLRVLEHGKGPLIEIAWPQNARQRDGLHDKFQTCFGMENALMDDAGDLYRVEDARGQRWEINLDRFSGFLRQASGRLPATEQRIKRAVSRRHGQLDDPIMVRIFPRRVDASLLGGLKAVVGERYMQAKSIQARYELKGSRILVRDIHLDGRALKGVVELSKIKRCSGRA
ncbi:hypothetical protein RYZ26_02045 [Terasakiella sp. A23]|uniref:hypothetical protein n=1 Tax=Terasakiella sp. FCG-A23 TaxID=3080561 RepID=UPI0029539729|nr:hypothetical protein [Terasakiella sp. A23]MDV7338360.1 hypothetical protein [Terasakiella sp. A23]